MIRRCFFTLIVGGLSYAVVSLALVDLLRSTPFGSSPVPTQAAGAQAWAQGIPEVPTQDSDATGTPKAPEEESKYGPSCLQAGCHADLAQSKALHGPVAVLACTPCHAPVEGEEHEFEMAREEADLCTFCHGMPEAADIVHEPFEKRSCTGCHDTHYGTDRRLLVDVESTGELCFVCHSKDDEETIPHVHQPYDSGDCTGCHAAHQSNEDGLLRAAEPAVCLSCHEELAAALQGAKSVHKPVEAGACSSCHLPHGSEFPKILTAAYPDTLYAPYSEESYALCFACHSAKSFGDPDDLSTKFRDGKKNLHALHVNKEDKGRTCGACHSAHAADGPKLLKKEATFGEWNLPIGFKPTETGGTCATGCHKAYSYDRGPDEGTEAEGETSGPKDPPTDSTNTEDSPKKESN